jgi:hypothetical protein
MGHSICPWIVYNCHPKDPSRDISSKVLVLSHNPENDLRRQQTRYVDLAGNSVLLQEIRANVVPQVAKGLTCYKVALGPDTRAYF